MTHAFNSSAWEEDGSELEASLGYTVFQAGQGYMVGSRETNQPRTAHTEHSTRVYSDNHVCFLYLNSPFKVEILLLATCNYSPRFSESGSYYVTHI